MERALTMLVTGLLAAFLCGIAGFFLSLLIPGPEEDCKAPMWASRRPTGRSPWGSWSG